jgi:hypothetical protein
VTFPDNVFGPVLVQGVCIDSATGQFAFAYDQFPAVVSTKRHLSVKPATTIAAGTTLEIAPLGPPCIGALVDVLVGLSPVQPYSAKPAPRAGITVTLPEVSTSNWHAELVIPASLATGTYRIEASCSRNRQVLAVWEPTIVQVVPAN